MNVSDIINQKMSEMIEIVESRNANKKKSVRFNEYVLCYIINNKEYYTTQYLKTMMWWSTYDFMNFRQNAERELAFFLKSRYNSNKKYENIHKNLWYIYDEIDYTPRNEHSAKYVFNLF
jgi:hypothetical protein